MSPEELVTIAKYSDPHEASMARAMLESHGIPGAVIGGEINNTLWHLGTTIPGVELKVRASEAEKAAELLDSIRQEEPPLAQHAWICPNCGEEVEAGFEVCWSCGTSIAELQEAAQESPAATEPAELDETDVVEPGDEIEADLAPPDWADRQARRALKTGACGILFPPLLVYSLYLLLDLSDEELSPSALRDFYTAGAIVLVMLGAWLVFLVEFWPFR